MNHLDEGTIHAWLDGALSAAQSAEVEAHVKGCAECSANVAEARGLIAASSRILVSLDDTPANVIPKKALASAPPRRRLSTASWVSGLAAAAVIVMLWRTGGVEHPASSIDTVVPKVDLVSGVPEVSIERLKEPALPPPAATTPVVAEQRQSRVASQARAVDGRGAGAGAVVGSAAASDLASFADKADRLRIDTVRTRSAPAEMATTAVAKAEDPRESIAGCYRIPPQETLVTAAAEARAPERAARTRGAVSSAAPAPAAVQKAAADVTPGVVVRLDSLGLVRAISSDSVIGAWVHVKADSARARLGSRNEIVSNLNKVRCP